MSIGDPTSLDPTLWSWNQRETRILKLTGYTGQPVWIVASKLCAFDHNWSSEGNTRLYLAGGDTYQVKETPEQILEML